MHLLLTADEKPKDINHKTTVQHIKLELRRRRLISDPSDRRTYIMTAPTRILPLRDDEQLSAIGIGELTTIHIHTKIHGGTRAAKDSSS